jgi:hypothetical protein
MRLLLISDTHVPGRGRRVPEAVWRAVDAADVVVHAGDWVGAELLDALERRSRRLIGVYGNNDGPALRARLPEVATAELDGLRLAVVHETGAATGRERRCARQFPDTDPADTRSDRRVDNPNRRPVQAERPAVLRAGEQVVYPGPVGLLHELHDDSSLRFPHAIRVFTRAWPYVI